MMPTIAVVIPAYNAAVSLPRALDSVLAQTHAAHQIIVVDDGSTDATADIMQPYLANPRVRYQRQTNAGPSAARNAGVALASADWVAFLDADDWYYPTRLARHAQMIAADPTLDFLVGNFDYRDSQGGFMHTSMSACAFGRELLMQAGEQGDSVIADAALGRFMAEQFSDTRMLTLPRKAFLELGGFPLDLKICEDVVFMLRLCAQSTRAGVVCEAGAVYSVHDAGLIRSDRLRAQTETLRALRLQAPQMRSSPAAIHDAWQHLVKGAYLNLAYYSAKHGLRRAAISSVLRSFAFRPTLGDVRHLLSVVRG
jgi:Glycosyltransferases involved in cell wall biogenesis